MKHEIDEPLRPKTEHFVGAAIIVLSVLIATEPNVRDAASDVGMLVLEGLSASGSNG